MSPFDPKNKPPTGHLKPEKIAMKPVHIADLNSLRDKKPLAGRFSEIGHEHFKVGVPNVRKITTGPWGEIQMEDSEAQRIKFEKSFPQFPQNKKHEQGENHTHLHRIYIPPAYLEKTCTTNNSPTR